MLGELSLHPRAGGCQEQGRVQAPRQLCQGCSHPKTCRETWLGGTMGWRGRHGLGSLFWSQGGLRGCAATNVPPMGAEVARFRAVRTWGVGGGLPGCWDTP